MNTEQITGAPAAMSSHGIDRHDLTSSWTFHRIFGDIALLSSSFPRIDDVQVTVYKIINISCNDRSLMSPTNSGDLGIKLGDRDAFGSAMGSESGIVSGSVWIER